MKGFMYILQCSDGSYYTGSTKNKEDVTATIVAAPLFCVRPDTEKVLPDFLLWWINQASSQAYLAAQAEGTMVKMVSKRSLDNLEVRLPPLPTQKNIVELFSLALREQQLLKAMQQRKADYIQGILMQMASAP